MPPSIERNEQLERERYRYARSPGVKAVHLRKMKQHKRKTDASISRMADRTNVLTPCRQPVLWWPKDKRSGGTRPICNAPTQIRLGQLIARDLIVAQFRPDDRLYDWPGRGIHAYVTDIRAALEAVGPYAFILDIKSCYEHVNLDNIEKLNLLPAELIESCIDTRCLSFRRSHRKGESSLTASVVFAECSTDPSGLMQGGPASSAIVVALLGSVSGSFPALVWGGGYADDFTVVGAGPPIAGEAGGKLTRYLTECLLGPSEFRQSRVLDVRDGIHHVGCFFWQNDDTVEACIPSAKEEALIARMTANIRNPKPEDRHRDFDHFVRKALGPYPWAVDWQRERIVEAAQDAWARRGPMGATGP